MKDGKCDGGMGDVIRKSGKCDDKGKQKRWKWRKFGEGIRGWVLSLDEKRESER